jgi:uncharacterized metal-binding protein YceD (DUF177 family)
VVDLKNFEVEIYQLKVGIHHYDFEITNEFFQVLGTSLVERGHLKAHVALEKSKDFFQLNFLIQGHVMLVCDRSLEVFEQPIEVRKSLILRYAEKAEEISDDLETIPFDTLTIQLAKYIYEYIGLEIPYKKLHPKFRDQLGEEDDPLVYQTETYKKEDLEDDIDPRWKALLKLKNN